MPNCYKPEGMLIQSPQNAEYISSLKGLTRAMACGAIVEGYVTLCDSNMRLHVDLGGIEGIVPREESLYSHTDEQIKDIALISRVGKPIAFKITSIDTSQATPTVTLSRRAAQEECMREYLMGLRCGDIIDARVTHLDAFGAFVDIGCGIVSLLCVDCLSVSRISHPRDRLTPGAHIRVVVKSIDRERRRFFVSQRELLGTWEENAALFEAGQTVSGIVRSVESYGVFVELMPNLAGLAELREDLISEDMVGKEATVYIKSIIPERMKVKLVLIDVFDKEKRGDVQKYFISESKKHIDRWQYSPSACAKVIETVF
jgi:small subunit ribosomal protein S1